MGPYDPVYLYNMGAELIVNPEVAALFEEVYVVFGNMAAVMDYRGNGAGLHCDSFFFLQARWV
jgi:hypothetical protein